MFPCYVAIHLGLTQSHVYTRLVSSEEDIGNAIADLMFFPDKPDPRNYKIGWQDAGPGLPEGARDYSLVLTDEFRAKRILPPPKSRPALVLFKGNKP